MSLCLSTLVLGLNEQLTGGRLPCGTFSEHAHPCLRGDLLHFGVGRSMRLSSSNAYLFLKEAEEKNLFKFTAFFYQKVVCFLV